MCSVIRLMVSCGGRNLISEIQVPDISAFNAGELADYPDSGYIHLSGKPGDNCCYMMAYI
ncbi:Uncharacterised protein [Pragia fontium]|nr:Uncharacterised protein [Pragia fontium]